MSANRNNKKVKKPIETTLGTAPANTKKTDDVAELRQPIKTNLCGVNQILRLLEDATLEVKNYIMYECEVIYECKVCQSLFRSLANFILHKRKYCKDNSTQHHSTTYQEIVTSQSTSNSNSPETVKASLDSIINKLHQSEQIKQDVQRLIVKDLGSDSASKSIKNMDDREKNASNFNTLRLEKIDSNNAAVYQTLTNTSSNMEENISIKNEIIEIHKHLVTDVALLNPEGKIDKFTTEIPNTVSSGFQLECSKCKRRFSSKRSLMDHVKLHHNESKMVYPCPNCKNIFANPWCVYRHLLKVHKLGNKQIKRMREQINNNWSLRIEESTSKKKTTNEKRQIDETSIEYQWIKHIEGDKDFQMCAGCGKHFDRKAALNSHSQMCIKRMEMCNNIEQNAKKRREEASTSELVEQKQVGASKRKQKSTIMYCKRLTEVEEKADEKVESTSCDTNVTQSNAIQDSDILNLNVTEEILKLDVKNENTTAAVQVEETTAETEKVPEQIIVIEEQDSDNLVSSVKKTVDKIPQVDVPKEIPSTESQSSNAILESIPIISQAESDVKEEKSISSSIFESIQDKPTVSFKNDESLKLLKNDTVSSDLPTFESFYQKACIASGIHSEQDPLLLPPLKKRRKNLAGATVPDLSNTSGDELNQNTSTTIENSAIDCNETQTVQENRPENSLDTREIDVDLSHLTDLHQITKPVELIMPADISSFIKSFDSFEEPESNTIQEVVVVNESSTMSEMSTLPTADDSNDEWDIPQIKAPVITHLKKSKKQVVVSNSRPCRNRTKRKQSDDFVYYDEEKNNIFNSTELMGKSKTYNAKTMFKSKISNVQKKK